MTEPTDTSGMETAPVRPAGAGRSGGADHDAAGPIDTAAVLLLQTWFSASFPTGAFSFSHGLEAAIDDGRLPDAASCETWLRAILEHGSAWNDALLFGAAHRAVCDEMRGTADDQDSRDGDASAALSAANDLALALCSGAERWHETTTQGAAFLAASSAWPQARCAALERLQTHDDGPRQLALPIASGALCATAMPPPALPLPVAMAVASQSMVANLVWIAVRLVPLGQSDGLAIIAALAPATQSMAVRAAQCSLDDIGSGALMADIASLQHEQMRSRVCQS